MTVSTDQGLTANAGAPSTLGARIGAAAASPPAWHPDPTDRFPLRYWDGTQWTANVVNADRQVGIDRGWAEAKAGPTGATPVEAVDDGDADGPEAEADDQADDRHATHRHEEPVERFDISPAAVMGRRATAAPSKPDADPAPRPDGATGAAPTMSAAETAPPARRWARSRAATGPSEDDPEARRGLLTRIGGVKVLAVAGVALVVLVMGLGLAWASAARSYDAQEAWQQRAEQWEERAGEHADERDEAIARIGRSRGRNRELNEENAEQQRQIEDLAADNAALTDENRLLNDALNSLGYELAP